MTWKEPESQNDHMDHQPGGPTLDCYMREKECKHYSLSHIIVRSPDYPIVQSSLTLSDLSIFKYKSPLLLKNN